MPALLPQFRAPRYRAARRPPRYDRGGGALRGRRTHGRRPACHLRQPHQPQGIEKVFAADPHSAVGIAGAAGPAMEMVKLFQLQLEHYEKVEGDALSLEGKANQLGRMVRNHLPAAMQGMAVVPLFAGYDRAAAIGRLFQYDVTGGRYEEHELSRHRLGQPARGTVLARVRSPSLDDDGAIELALSALVTQRTRTRPPAGRTCCVGSTPWWRPSAPRASHGSPRPGPRPVRR